MRPNQNFINNLTIYDSNVLDIQVISNGSITTDGLDTIITFNQNGSFRVTGQGTMSLFLVGGGSGGNTATLRTGEVGAGGGGGGGIFSYVVKTLVDESNLSMPPGVYDVIVGTGGGPIGTIDAGGYIGDPGNPTIIEKNGDQFFLAVGGGTETYTQYDYPIGRNGGWVEDLITPPPSVYFSPNVVLPRGSGGSSPVGSGFTNGNGAIGFTSSIRGSVELFGGAGGGGVYSSDGVYRTGGLGATGGGGDGGSTTSPVKATQPEAGAPNTGGGGGGGSIYYQSFNDTTFFSYGATGGSGIAIIRYRKK